MKKVILITSTILVFAILNYGIFEKEQIKKNGETLLLELAPFDPRSLIQGDYMRLVYSIQQSECCKEKIKSGAIVLTLDQNKVGTFKRFYKGKELAANEKLLHYHTQHGELRITPDSFMFQEGHAKFYENAKYAVFKLDNKGGYILVGLADDKMQLIQPDLML